MKHICLQRDTTWYSILSKLNRNAKILLRKTICIWLIIDSRNECKESPFAKEFWQTFLSIKECTKKYPYMTRNVFQMILPYTFHNAHSHPAFCTDTYHHKFCITNKKSKQGVITSSSICVTNKNSKQGVTTSSNMRIRE